MVAGLCFKGYHDPIFNEVYIEFSRGTTLKNLREAIELAERHGYERIVFVGSGPALGDGNHTIVLATGFTSS